MTTKCKISDPQPDSSISAHLLGQLAREGADAVGRELCGCDINQVWTAQDRILFRLADGRTGDVEVLVNWDVAGGVGQQKE